MEKKLRLIVFDCYNRIISPYQAEDMILSLIAENELGDSDVTGEHGALHDVAIRTAHGSETETSVERPLPSIPDYESAFITCDKCGKKKHNLEYSDSDTTCDSCDKSKKES